MFSWSRKNGEGIASVSDRKVPLIDGSNPARLTPDLGRYLALMRESAQQRVYPLREIFNALRYQIRVGGAWRMMPHDLPPWHMVYQQTQRWIKAGCFEAMTHDLRTILRLALERKADPSAVIWTAARCSPLPKGGRGLDVAPERNEYTAEPDLVNSHDRSSTYHLHAGLFRFVCGNGMIVADATFEV